MAALNFPSSPTVGQQYTANGSTWEWNGAAWVSKNLLSGQDVLDAVKTVDGTGSGLDADFLDGNHATAFYLATNPNGYNTGTVTSVGGTGSVAGLSLSGTVTSSGNLTLGGTLSVAPSNFASQTANTFLSAPNGTAGTPTFRTIAAADVPTLNQNTTGTASNVTGTVAIANGGTGATTAAGAVSALGAYPASNPNGYTSNSGTVTSVGGTGTVNGLTLSGTVTSSGNITLGGTLSNVSLTSQVTGTLPVANGGTGVTTSTGTGNVVLSAGPSFTSNTGSLFTVTGLSGIGSSPVVSISGQTNDCLALELTNGIGSARTRFSMQAGGGSTDFFIDDAGSTFAGSTYASVGPNTVAIYTSSAKPNLILGVSGASSSLRFGTNSTERVRIDASGNVGIGTNTPSTMLHVAGALTLGTALSVANGGTGATTAPSALTNLGGTTVGSNLFTLTNPSAITFPRINADNTVSALDATTFRTAIGSGNGTVTSVSGTGTVNGLTLTGTVTGSGSLTLGGTLSNISLASQVTNTLPVVNGGTGVSPSGITGVIIGNGTSAFTSKTNPSGAFVGTTDTQTLTSKTFGNYTETVFTVFDQVGAVLDPDNGPIQTWTLAANRTPTQANWDAGQSITLMIDDGSAFTVTWTTLGVVWETNGGTAPTLTTTGFTVIVLWKVGTTIYGARVGDA